MIAGCGGPKVVQKQQSMELPVIVRHYIQRCRPRCQAELDWFKNQSSVKKAIEYAALAVDKDGKRFSHQRRITPKAIEQAKAKLLAAADALVDCTDFDELFDLAERLLSPIHGIGELYTYDVSLRIGAKLGLLPQKVYLHAGTREGAKALGLNSKSQALEVHSLPPALRQLLPHEVEDVLCIYKAGY